RVRVIGVLPMTGSNGLWFGSLDADKVAWIPDIAAEMSSLLGSFECVLITEIDSSRALNPPGPPAGAWLEETNGIPVFGHGNALRTTGTEFLQIAKHGKLFTGFDEVWFLRSEPLVEPQLGLCISV